MKQVIQKMTCCIRCFSFVENCLFPGTCSFLDSLRPCKEATSIFNHCTGDDGPDAYKSIATRHRLSIAFMLESSHWMLQGCYRAHCDNSTEHRRSYDVDDFPVLPPQQWRWPHSATGAVDAFGTVSKSLEQDGFCLQRQCQLELVNFRANV